MILFIESPQKNQKVWMRAESRSENRIRLKRVREENAVCGITDEPLAVAFLVFHLACAEEKSRKEFLCYTREDVDFTTKAPHG